MFMTQLNVERSERPSDQRPIAHGMALAEYVSDRVRRWIMKHLIGRGAGLAGVALLSLLPALANAQLEGMLGKSGHGTGLKGMAGLASSPLTSGSMSNVAGLLQYCIGNNVLSADSAGPVKDQLMGKLPGGSQNKDPGYSDGAKGLLHGSNGNLMDLNAMGSMGGSGGGTSAGAGAGAGTGDLTGDLKKKACDTVLAQAKSFL
jgi:hypothetical protein